MGVSVFMSTESARIEVLQSTAGFLETDTLVVFMECVGLARTIYIRCTYGIFGLKITKYTVYMYVYIRFWPTLGMWELLTGSVSHYKLWSTLSPVHQLWFF